MILSLFAMLGALCAAQITAPLSSEVTSMALDFGDALTKVRGGNTYPQMLSQLAFFDESSVIQAYTELPMGGVYRGTDEIKNMYRRCSMTMSVDSQSYNLLSVDEASGQALMDVRIIGTFKRSGKPADLHLLAALEIDPVSRKIMTLLFVQKNKAQTHEAYQTRAEDLLEEMITAFFKSSPEELKAGTGAWDLVSDQINVKVNMYPELFDKSEWNGKPDLLAHMKEAHSTKYAFMEKMPELLQHMTFKILYSDNDQVWAKFTWPGYGDGMIKHYKFDNQGLLVAEEITMLGTLRPWQIYPLPFEQQIKQDQMKLRSTQSQTLTTGPIGKMYQVGTMNVHSNKLKFETEYEMNIEKHPSTEPVSFCDSTQPDQICPDGTPCSMQFLECESPQLCKC